MENFHYGSCASTSFFILLCSVGSPRRSRWDGAQLGQKGLRKCAIFSHKTASTAATAGLVLVRRAVGENLIKAFVRMAGHLTVLKSDGNRELHSEWNGNGFTE